MDFEFTTDDEFNLVYFLWTYLFEIHSVIISNYHHSKDLLLFQLRDTVNEETPTQVVETLLPSINAKVNGFSTIQRYMIYLKRLANSVEMPYVNITLDVGSTINAF